MWPVELKFHMENPYVEGSKFVPNVNGHMTKMAGKFVPNVNGHMTKMAGKFVPNVNGHMTKMAAMPT